MPQTPACRAVAVAVAVAVGGPGRECRVVLSSPGCYHILRAVDAVESLRPLSSARAASALGNFPPSLHPAASPRRRRDDAELNSPLHLRRRHATPRRVSGFLSGHRPRAAPRNHRAKSNRSGTLGDTSSSPPPPTQGA
jgi:hypothetical protein